MRYFTLLFLLACSSCVRLKEIPFRASFPGIHNESACATPINVLIVHGLGGYSEGDPESLVDAIERKLQLAQVENSVFRPICKNNNYYGYLVYTDYEGPSDKVRIYNLYWSPTTSFPKSILESIDNQHSSNRIQMIRDLKKDFINGTCADAVLYVSNYRKEIQYPFEKTFEWIESERRGIDVVVVGFSLGSSIVIDTLDEMENRELASNFVRQIKEVFMLSNPAPLFDLAKWSCMTDQYSWDYRNWSIGRFVYEKRKYQPGFKIIAISDPNDALSYIADSSILTDLGWENVYQNIQVRNVKWSLFGLVNPMEAHTGYGKNAEVQDLIIFGSD